MTNEQINIAIAEACGWNYLDSRTIYPRGIKDGVTLELPDYCKCLNVMHEATMMLEDQQLCEMADWLEKITGFHTRIFHATAPQRAEAFLKTIGKWEDEK